MKFKGNHFSEGGIVHHGWRVIEHLIGKIGHIEIHGHWFIIYLTS